MTGLASGQLPEYRQEYAEQARRLALLGAEDEAFARFFGVPVYVIYEWEGAHLEFAKALAAARLKARRKAASLSAKGDPYPAYTWALWFCHETGRTELADMLNAKMAEMKALGPETAAAFNDAIWNDIMLERPGRNIPMRSE